MNFHGNVSGQIAIGDSNQLTQQSSSDTDLQALLAAILSAAAGTREEEQVGRLVTAVQLEADQDEPDAHVLNKNVQRLQAVGQKAGGAALTPLGNLVDWISHGLGLG